MARWACAALPAAAAAILVVGGAGAAEGPTLAGSVGPGFGISLVQADGTPVRSLDPGTYAVEVRDLSQEHNFHLTGPGVDERTQIEEAEEVTWTVALADGAYAFLCDVHPTRMKGSFTVGDRPAAPPPPPRLLGRVGPGSLIALTTASGARLTAVTKGPFTIVVRDLSVRDNFHFKGPGVNRRTGVARRGTATWNVTLVPGTYRYLSDAHPTLRGSLRVAPKAGGG